MDVDKVVYVTKRLKVLVQILRLSKICLSFQSVDIAVEHTRKILEKKKNSCFIWSSKKFSFFKQKI